jgi:HJR/Mrr/RecB family endonuclease
MKSLRDLYSRRSQAVHADIKPSNVLFEAGLLASGVLDVKLKDDDIILHLFGHGWKATEKVKEVKPLSTLVLSALILPEAKVADGMSIQTITVSWQEIVKHLEKNWDTAYEIPPEKWEEIIAGAFKKEGYHEVILTPRSGDGGRDVIAIRRGVGTVKF